MKVGVVKEIVPGETRVAATPETVSKMMVANMEVLIESSAGKHAYFSDQDYTQAGAHVLMSAKEVYAQTDVVLKVQPPFNDEVDFLREGSTLIAPLYPVKNADLIKKLNAKKITAFSLELLPRIARAQSMDILSSMSNLAGYKSVMMAAEHLGKIFPMMTTAAGTILPAKVIVIGAGVAGLQAIATARRLGGVVIAFDTRPAAREQVKSLGADFVSMETTHENAQDAGGYAKEQTTEFYQHEQDIIAKYLKEADVVISTALIPGKRAPILITENMVQSMKQGSVIVDLAAEQQGNCLLCEPGQIVVKHGVTIIGVLNIPSLLPVHASQLYSKNIFTFLNYTAPCLASQQWNFSDDIIKNCLLTYNGETVHPAFKQT